MDINNNTIWFTCPTLYNHKEQRYDILNDPSIISMLHAIFASETDSIDVVLPKLTDHEYKTLMYIGDNFLDGCLNIIQEPSLFGTTYTDNCNAFKNNFDSFDMSDWDYVISAIPTRFNEPTQYVFNDTHEKSMYADALRQSKEELSKHFGSINIDDIKLDEGFKKVLTTYKVTTHEFTPQESDLIESLADNSYIVFDMPLETVDNELKDFLSKPIKQDNIIISNPSKLDEGLSLSIVNDALSGLHKKNKKKKIVIIDPTDDVDVRLIVDMIRHDDSVNNIEKFK